MSKGPYLILNTININAYHKFSPFLCGTSMKVLFMYKKKKKSLFFPTILCVLEEMGKDENVLEFRMF